MGSLSLDRYHFYFLMILKETLTFLSLSNPVLQYCKHRNFSDLTIMAIIATKLKTLLMLSAINSRSLFLVKYILVIYTQGRYF